MEDWQLAEYNNCRKEVHLRVKMLHQMITLSVILIFTSVIILVAMRAYNTNWEVTRLFLLLVPLVFATLTYNYQANQMTMEAVARFADQIRNSKFKEESWDNYYGKHKLGVQLISFMKVIPLLLPQILPIVLFFTDQQLSQIPLYFILAVIDLALFAVAIFNFRYKL